MDTILYKGGMVMTFDVEGWWGQSYILKQQWCLSVCVGSAWKILPVTARSLWCLW